MINRAIGYKDDFPFDHDNLNYGGPGAQLEFLLFWTER